MRAEECQRWAEQFLKRNEVCLKEEDIPRDAKKNRKGNAEKASKYAENAEKTAAKAAITSKESTKEPN